VTVALLATLGLTLAACQLQPLYGGGPHGLVSSTLGQIQVAPIGEESGYLVRRALIQRLGADNGSASRYRLEVQLDDRIIGFGIRSDTSRSRERRTLRARYQLVDLTTNAVLLDATAASDEAIDVVQSEYAVVAAEKTALERLSVSLADQIALKLAVFARTAPQPAAR
jgi:LPS-assembly lipoprotein